MKKKLCPQCKVGRFRVKNLNGDTVVVEVNELFEIKTVHANESLEGFDLDILYCLGCSWSGSSKKLVKH